MSKVKPQVKKLYYSIGEVSRLTNLKAYVLRYWESEFSALKPPKNRAGNRTYRQKDIDTILKIKDLLYKKRYTIDGAREALKTSSDGGFLNARDSKSIVKQDIVVGKIRKELEKILTIISE
tara:strand:- start:8 stop:370 length:363 start_codon:yes stop_codon:yes gene_type:complete